MKRRRLLLIGAQWVGGAAITLGSVWLTAYMLNLPARTAPFGIAAQFLSPDGQITCIVWERKPQGLFMESPYDYRFELKDARGSDLDGKAMEIGRDSAALSNFNVKWNGNRVIVRDESFEVASCNFAHGFQRWRYYQDDTAPASGSTLPTTGRS